MRLLLLLIGLTIVVGCSEFPTDFDRIEKTEVRLLDFVYEPAEASPGDTVHVKAIFSGKKVNSANIDWKVSFNVANNMYGMSDTAFDLQPLKDMPQETFFTDQTTCLEFSVAIPENIMHTSSGIPNNWLDIIPEEYRDSIPEEFKKLSKEEMLALVDKLKGMDKSQLELFFVLQPELKTLIPVICQMLTVEFRLFADIKNEYLIRSDYSVRYNSFFQGVSGVFITVNKNPRIDSIGIYKVPGNLTEYNPQENKHEFCRIDINAGPEKTLLIDKDYSYFVRVFTNLPDTTRTLTDLTNGGFHYENLYTKWFFAMDSVEMKDISTDDYMNIKGDELMECLLPPAKEKIKKFTIWVQVYDSMIDEILRPSGSQIMEARGVFSYTPAYLKSNK